MYRTALSVGLVVVCAMGSRVCCLSVVTVLALGVFFQLLLTDVQLLTPLIWQLSGEPVGISEEAGYFFVPFLPPPPDPFHSQLIQASIGRAVAGL